MGGWVVAMTKPNAENIAAVNLQRQGYECYFPRFLQKKPNKSVAIRPLFPRYMFILTLTSWYPLTGTRGISRLIMSETGPQFINPEIINTLRSREDKNGFIALAAPPKFMNGDKVRVCDGPLLGHLAIYEGMTSQDRVKILIELLGRKVHTVLELKSLTAA